MVVPRLLIAALALIVSPVGAAVCEVACGTPVHAAMPSEPAASEAVATDSHHHHHQAESEDVPEASGSRQSRLEGRPRVDCDPVTSVPARIRGAFSDTPALALLGHGECADRTTTVSLDHPAVPIPPSSPPHHAPVPLRI